MMPKVEVQWENAKVLDAFYLALVTIVVSATGTQKL
jgi:hypothetical protein